MYPLKRDRAVSLSHEFSACFGHLLVLKLETTGWAMGCYRDRGHLSRLALLFGKGTYGESKSNQSCSDWTNNACNLCAHRSHQCAISKRSPVCYFRTDLNVAQCGPWQCITRTKNLAIGYHDKMGEEMPA